MDDNQFLGLGNYGLLIRRHFLAKHQPEWWDEHFGEATTTSEIVAIIKEEYPEEIGAVVKFLTKGMNQSDGNDFDREQNIMKAQEDFGMNLAVELPPGIPGGYTFEGFEANNNSLDVAEAFNAVNQWHMHEAVSKPILLLAGPPGTGKTHLAAAAAAELLASEEEIVFRTESDLIADIRRGFGGQGAEDYIDAYSSVLWLVIDDLGVEAQSDTFRAIIDRIINARWQNAGGLWTMITTNLMGSDLPPRIASRLGDKAVSTVVQIDDADDYRSKER